MRASTATHARGNASTGFRSSSATSGKSTASRDEAVQEIAEHLRVGRGRAAEAGDQARGLAARTSSSASTSVSGAIANCVPADQLRQHAAGAERHERPEDRVLHDAGEQLDAAGQVLLDEHRVRRCARPRRRTWISLRRSSATPPSSVLCTPGSAVLTTAGKPRSARRGRRLLAGCRRCAA